MAFILPAWQQTFSDAQFVKKEIWGKIHILMWDILYFDETRSGGYLLSTYAAHLIWKRNKNSIIHKTSGLSVKENIFPSLTITLRCCHGYGRLGTSAVK